MQTKSYIYHNHALFQLQFNLTHHIRHLSFGHEYPGLKHPLDDTYVASEDGKMCLCVLWMDM